MKTSPIIWALVVAITAGGEVYAQPKYSPEYVAQIDQNLRRYRSHCANLEAAKREVYDDKRLIATLRALESYAVDIEAGKIDIALLDAARRTSRLTQADVDCGHAMVALEAYIIRKCQADPKSCTYE